MSRVTVIGEATRASWFAVTGASVLPADDPESALEAWRCLTPETVVVVVTPMAAAALAPEIAAARSILVVALPASFTRPQDGTADTEGGG